MILLEAGNLDGLLILIGAVMFGPAILMTLIGIILYIKKHPKAAKILFILSAVYVIISLGICGSILT